MTSWTQFVDLAALVGRPLVFFDFETAGIGRDENGSQIPGPPCEFALLVIDPREEAAGDSETAAAIEAVASPSIMATTAHGVCYAVSSRCNPGEPITPGAQAVHGISDADVADALPYNEPQIVGLFEHFNDAIWCGHNVAAFDLPCAYRHRLLPPGRDFFDTMRLARRCSDDRQFPDAWDPTMADDVPPVAEGGLQAFSKSLTGLHYALTGSLFDGAHGALADVIANVRVAQGLINGWFSLDVMTSMMVDSTDKAEALATMLRCFNAPPRAMVGHDGWIRRISLNGRDFYEFTRGKHSGRDTEEVRRDDPSYIRWLLSLTDLDETTREFLSGPQRSLV